MTTELDVFHQAVTHNNYEFLLDNLVNVYQIDLGEGNTSLHIAAKYRSTKILTYLLSLSDIDINAVNNGGKSAFDLFMFFFLQYSRKI